MRSVVLAGASGLVGRALLQRLLADDAVRAVHALVRRPLGLRAARLHEHVVDLARLPPLPPLDEAYLALGTTIKAAGSRAAFRAVDFDATVAVARAALAAGARRAGLVSALGADGSSAVFYNRVKAETEAAVSALAFEGLVIARPSLLIGDRTALGQPARPLEVLMERVDRVAGPLLPRGWRGIPAGDVADALLAAVPKARGVVVLPSAAMRR